MAEPSETDLERRLGEALARGAERAPGAHGLAAASRRRWRVRRRRAVAAGAVVVVLAVVAPLAVAGWIRDDDDAPAVDRAEEAEVGWRTVEVTLPRGEEGTRLVVVDLPEDWVELPASADCVAAAEYGPPGSEPCTSAEGLSFVADSDYLARPGLRPASELEADGGEVETAWTGTVSLDGGGVAILRSDDEQRVLRGLGSVRRRGQDAPRSDAPWTLKERGGLAYRLPTDRLPIEVTVGPRPGAADELSSGPAGGGRWRATRDLAGLDRRIGVVAPTRALAELVAGSARAAGGAPFGWTTLTVGDVDLDVPSDWEPVDTAGCEFEIVAFGPPGTEPCSFEYPLAVYGSATFDPGDYPGLVRSETGWGGYVLTDDSAVNVAVGDRATARRVLASVRPSGEPAVDVTTWRALEVSGGLTAQVPAGAGVEVRASTTEPGCGADARDVAGQRPDGRWAVELCRDGLLEVVAPSRALADVVASTVVAIR